jgi:NitT/TauT family transport system substrate-binding protein
MQLTVALDWTPNVIHAGLYLAHINGYYQKAGLEVEFISTDVDNYTRKPIERLADKEVDFALGPSEHLITYRELKEPQVPVIAVATIMQKETSAFVTLASSGIDRPAQLDGKTYAGYKTVLETNLITEMIRNDGGKGNINLITPPRLSVFEGFLQGQADTCWVFMPWEGVIAEHRGMDLHAFYLNEYGVPYGYSPIIMTHEGALAHKEEDFRKFMQATAQGYREAAHNPEAAAEVLTQNIDHSNFEDAVFIRKAMQAIAPSLLGSDGQWGKMQHQKWESYTHWLIDHNMLRLPEGRLLKKDEVNVRNFYTNQLLE